jgi:hypothetical protein
MRWQRGRKDWAIGGGDRRRKRREEGGEIDV